MPASCRVRLSREDAAGTGKAKASGSFVQKAQHGTQCKSPGIIGASLAWMGTGVGRAIGGLARLGLHSMPPAAVALGLHITIIPGMVLPGAPRYNGTHQELLGSGLSPLPPHSGSRHRLRDALAAPSKPM